MDTADEGVHGQLVDTWIGVLHTSNDRSEHTISHLLIQERSSLLIDVSDETQSHQGRLLDINILIVHIRYEVWEDIGPLTLWNFDCADCGDVLHYYCATSAVALFTFRSLQFSN